MDDRLLLLLIKGFFFGFVPLFCLWFGVGSLRRTRRFIARAYRTTGTVIERDFEVPAKTGPKHLQHTQHGRPAWRPTFAYVDAQGRQRTATTRRATRAFNFEKGSEQEILVDADDDAIADIPGRVLYLPGTFSTVLGLGFAVGGLYAWGVL